MGSLSRFPSSGRFRCEVVDIKSELEQWKRDIHEYGFYEPGVPFKKYEPSLLFAYDAYLQHHKIPLDELLRTLEAKYSERFDRMDRMDWHVMRELLQQVWQRMGGSLGSTYTTQ
jgi:hypothetical protein